MNDVPHLVDTPLPEDAADIVVIGAGPAGLAAAEAAASQVRGARVVVIDAAPRPGGQVWRAVGEALAPEVDERLARLARLGVELRAGTRAAWALDGQRLLLDHGRTSSVLRWRRLVIATGAREKLLPFPGSTRPGVYGAGGLQALAKGGWPVAGRRVLVAGTGPLLLATAATLRRAGAVVVEVAEEADRGAVGRFVASMALRHARPLVAALKLGAALRGVPYRAGWRVAEATSASADGPVAGVTLVHADGRTRTVACYALAAGWGLMPQVDLARALGCVIEQVRGDAAVRVDADQRTSVGGVFAAGEPTGIAGVDAALASGRIAGRTAARDLATDARSSARAAAAATTPAVLIEARHDDAPVRRALACAQRFADLVARTFPAPTDLASRWRDDTLVCRCEDVPWSVLRPHADLRSAKLATRCGMGHCQGRLCHPALARRDALPLPVDGSARPPLSPMPLSHLLALTASPDAPGLPSPTPEVHR